MHSIEWPSNAIENVVDTQFTKVYQLLVEIRTSLAKLEDIGRSIARCYQELRSLERIHYNRRRFYSHTSEDPFELRSTLQGFYNTCHSLKYIALTNEDDDVSADVGCALPSMPSKNMWRKRQTKAIENDLLEHERTISAILASIVYTTTLKISRAGRTSDLDAAFVLQCAEQRHEIYDRKQHYSAKSLRANDGTAEESEWKKTLSKYFRLMESWTAAIDLEGSIGSTSRASTLTQSIHSRSSIRQNATPPVSNDRFSAYSNYRRGEEVDTTQYFRYPRRKSVGTNSTGWVPADQAARNRLSTVNTTSTTPSQELVLYKTGRPTSSTSVATTRAIRRSSIKGDFHWEYVGQSSTFNLLQPLTTRWPELKDAQVDIYNQTQGMSSKEARAYALGRLAGLSPEITDEVRRVLSITPASQIQQQKTTPSRLLVKNVSDNYEPADVRRRSMSLDSPAHRDMTSNGLSTNAASRATITNPTLSQLVSNHKASLADSTQRPGQKLRKAPSSSHRRGFLSALADKRPMTAISERSARSALSKSSVDKSPGRSIMQSFKLKRSNVSQLSILETVPDKVENGGRSSSGSDTLISSNDLDMGDRPQSAHSQNTVKTSSTMNIQTSSTRPKRNIGPKLIAAIFGSKKSETHLEVPRAESALSMQSVGSVSQESLRRVSVELLKRRDSRMTMLSIGENLDIPFDIWIRALPYIEGRCASPFEN